jgi:hypothetical protein
LRREKWKREPRYNKSGHGILSIIATLTSLHSTIPTPYFLSPEQDPTLYVASYEPTSQIPSWNRSTFEQLRRAETDIRTVVTYSLERRSQTFLLTWIPFPLNPLHKRFHPHLPVPQHTYHTPFVPYLTQTPVFHLISSRSPSHRIPGLASPRLASPHRLSILFGWTLVRSSFDVEFGNMGLRMVWSALHCMCSLWT